MSPSIKFHLRPQTGFRIIRERQDWRFVGGGEGRPYLLQLWSKERTVPRPAPACLCLCPLRLSIGSDDSDLEETILQPGQWVHERDGGWKLLYRESPTRFLNPYKLHTVISKCILSWPLRSWDVGQPLRQHSSCVCLNLNIMIMIWVAVVRPMLHRSQPRQHQRCTRVCYARPALISHHKNYHIKLLLVF